MLLGLIGGLRHGDLVGDRLDPRTWDQMVMPGGILIVLGQADLIAADMIDGADMQAVRLDHLLMILHLAQQNTLALALFAPRAEFAVEPVLMLAAIFVIVAIEVAHLAIAPRTIALVMERRWLTSLV